MCLVENAGTTHAVDRKRLNLQKRGMGSVLVRVLFESKANNTRVRRMLLCSL